jgi:hypothetical protein
VKARGPTSWIVHPMSRAEAAAKGRVANRSHRVLVAVLVFLGALCLLVSTVSVWIRDVALDEDVWADTSSQLLESENVRNALSVYIVDQAYSASSAEVRLEEALPPALKPLAPQIASQLRGIAYETASTALARPRVQELWRSTNRAANAQLVDLLEGNTERLRVTGNAVVLDLDQIVANVAGQIGLGSSATQTIQERVEPVVIMRSDQLSTAQTIVKALKALSFWPLILALALWAGAVYLAGQRRREALRTIAISVALLGLLLLVVIRVAGQAVVNNLVQAESVRPAAEDVWAVLTGLLAASAAADIAVGLIALVGTWLSGPSVRAAGVRRWLAPTFRDRPVFVHLMLAAALLLVFLWSPTGTPRRLITLVVVVILAFVGLEIFRRQSIREFPTALHEGGSSWSSWFGKGRMTDGSPAEAEPSARLERLERLAALHERGALTDKEYEAEKALAL